MKIIVKQLDGTTTEVPAGAVSATGGIGKGGPLGPFGPTGPFGPPCAGAPTGAEPFGAFSRWATVLPAG